MSAERERMIAALKKQVVPVLRARGFKGSFPHFRRLTSTVIHLLTFQFDKWGGGFFVEIAGCPPEGATMYWGEHVPPAKVNAWHLNRRLRLGAPDEKTDGRWFRFDSKDGLWNDAAYEALASEVLPYLDKQAEAWWTDKWNASQARG